jgi:hypothetical protein
MIDKYESKYHKHINVKILLKLDKVNDVTNYSVGNSH